MIPLFFVAPLLVLAHAQSDDGDLEVAPAPAVNGTVEYSTFCRTCPYNLCTHVATPGKNTVYPLACWTNGDRVGDTDLWLKTSDECYVAEYDLFEHEGDFRSELEFCGDIPLEVTQQPAKVKYLSECKWGYYTSDESITYYGRDVDVTLTCWASGSNVMGDSYWYKTFNYCWVSGSGLWEVPDRDQLEWCGPEFGPRINESIAPLDQSGAKPAPLPIGEAAEDELDGKVEDKDVGNVNGLESRWLQPEQIGEEYANCYSCPSSVQDETCHLVTVYEFNDTVVSQCVDSNSASGSTTWMYTTDWCYVNGTEFWVPPWDYYRYPRCSYWGL